MDQARFEALKNKRFKEGLSDEEANELGRMFAEQEGEQYQSSDQFQAEAAADAEEEAARERGAQVAAEAPTDRGPGTEDRPESLKDEAEGRPEPDTDEPAGRRAPLGATPERIERDEQPG